MNILQIIALAIVQGAAELLPVSSSAHVIIAERLMGLDPSTPEMSFFLVMLHTGTMFSVLVYFWSRWLALLSRLRELVIATFWTGIVGLVLLLLITKVFLHGSEHAEVENLFRNLPLISLSLAAAGAIIIAAGITEQRRSETGDFNWRSSSLVGLIQGLSLPFRGFSRSGATISTAMLLNIERMRAEEFSFALAVILTPVVILWELRRLIKTLPSAHQAGAVAFHLFLPGLLGMCFSFLAGLVALKWLSSWLEKGRWQFFGYYCLFAAGTVLALYFILGAS